MGPEMITALAGRPSFGSLRQVGARLDTIYQGETEKGGIGGERGRLEDRISIRDLTRKWPSDLRFFCFLIYFICRKTYTQFFWHVFRKPTKT